MHKSLDRKLPPSSAISTAELIKNEAVQISNILIEAQECLKILDYLMYDDPAIDIYLKNQDYFWRFTSLVYTNQVLLKLNILLNPKEHYSISGFLKKLKSDGNFSGVLSEDEILDWERKINGSRSTCRKISVRRNKSIAHRDRGFISKKSDAITLLELKKIVALLQSLLKEIYQITIQSSFMINEPIGSPVESLKAIMLTLNEERRKKLTPLFKQAREYGLNDELPKSEQEKID